VEEIKIPLSQQTPKWVNKIFCVYTQLGMTKLAASLEPGTENGMKKYE
jgi:hypothetical protein